MDVQNSNIWVVSTADGKSINLDNVSAVGNAQAGSADNVTYVVLSASANILSAGDNVTIGAAVGDGTNSIPAGTYNVLEASGNSVTLNTNGVTLTGTISAVPLDSDGKAENVISPYLYVTKVAGGTTVTQNEMPIFSSAINAVVKYPDIAAHPAGAHAAVCYRDNDPDAGHAEGTTKVRIVTATSDGSEVAAIGDDNLTMTVTTGNLATGLGCSLVWDGTTSASDNGTLWLAKGADATTGTADKPTVLVYKSTDNGSTFTSVATIQTADGTDCAGDNCAADEVAIDMTLDGSNPVIAVQAHGAIEVHSYNGSTFEDITRTSASTAIQGTPVSIAVNGNVYAVSYFTTGGAPKTDIFYNQ